MTDDARDCTHPGCNARAEWKLGETTALCDLHRALCENACEREGIRGLRWEPLTRAIVLALVLPGCAPKTAGDVPVLWVCVLALAVALVPVAVEIREAVRRWNEDGSDR